MKRKGNLYEQICNIDNIISATNEVCRNTKNKRKINKFKDYKCVYVSRIYKQLKSRTYTVGPYNKFTIYEPKKREIVSQNIYDKVVNHLIARHILMPVIIPKLIDQNVASRAGLGTKRGLYYHYNYLRICKVKYKKFYILKCDISKFFASINHDILKEKLRRLIKDKDALKITFDVIDSVEQGLGIGNMTSQILAIFYLNDLDHFIKENLKIKYYVRYQDDFCLYHYSKEYLKFCLGRIKSFLENEKLKLNKKTRIYKNTDNFVFLGRNKYGKYAKYRVMNRRLNKKDKCYKAGKISLRSFVGTISAYGFLQKKYTYADYKV